MSSSTPRDGSPVRPLPCRPAVSSHRPNPTRVLDTRLASPLGVGVALAGGSTVTVPSPGDAAATLAFNVTTVDGELGYITAFPADTTRPTSSTLNARGDGDIAANFAIVPAGAAGLALFAQNTTHLVVDLAGSFSAASVDSFAPVPSTTVPPTTVPSTTAPPTTAPSTTAPTTTAPPTTAPTTAPTTTAPTGARPIVHLTFDDGPVVGASAAVMSLLEQYGLRGTFFLQGDFTTAMPAIAASTRARGHAIGNHTFNHLDLRTLTDAQIQSELRTAQGRDRECDGLPADLHATPVRLHRSVLRPTGDTAQPQRPQRDQR